MSNSDRTSWFGPWVSYRTSKSNPLPVHVAIPSGATLTVPAVASLKFSGITTASPTSVFIPDGFFSIVAHSANSMVIAVRSGATMYQFANLSGSVL